MAVSDTYLSCGVSIAMHVTLDDLQLQTTAATHVVLLSSVSITTSLVVWSLLELVVLPLLSKSHSCNLISFGL